MFHKEIRATKNTHRVRKDSQALGEVSTASSQQRGVSFNSSHRHIRKKRSQSPQTQTVFCKETELEIEIFETGFYGCIININTICCRMYLHYLSRFRQLDKTGVLNLIKE